MQEQLRELTQGVEQGQGAGRRRGQRIQEFKVQEQLRELTQEVERGQGAGGQPTESRGQQEQEDQDPGAIGTLSQTQRLTDRLPGVSPGLRGAPRHRTSRPY